ncbi:hypothetical protein GCM10022251_18430 [Phytohabitans flavus]|uniref:Uncharacterized protein n=1 Tax=Phytohabitans flavus TaxID=1076124 RepID=A0A6F8Y5Q4_9ACTN|nr:hypothetical protein Pflav_078000 [Phytohabitans flavus]
MTRATSSAKADAPKQKKLVPAAEVRRSSARLAADPRSEAGARPGRRGGTGTDLRETHEEYARTWHV